MPDLIPNEEELHQEEQQLINAPIDTSKICREFDNLTVTSVDHENENKRKTREEADSPLKFSDSSDRRDVATRTTAHEVARRGGKENIDASFVRTIATTKTETMNKEEADSARRDNEERGVVTETAIIPYVHPGVGRTVVLEVPAVEERPHGSHATNDSTVPVLVGTINTTTKSETMNEEEADGARCQERPSPASDFIEGRAENYFMALGRSNDPNAVALSKALSNALKKDVDVGKFLYRLDLVRKLS